ncbi:hypothetical protein [Klebsiella pneumoniae]|uniref:hypothetical protein n=1 Tax=Klebsiella pneumoniae TaxID=573 RepID=UPI000F7D9143|nr:hypothetical protein [Klebsiella pneumoniae]RTA29650.1 hypothetical protein EJ496_28145 [Klebsiella pneumoniae subsp. pneumoniae]
MATNSKIYWNYERPTRAVASVAIAAGVGLVLDTSLGDTNACVPKYKLPDAGGRIDGVALDDVAANQFFDLVNEKEKFVPVKAAAAFGVGVELAVTAAGKFQTATTGQLVVAISQTKATAADQVVTALVRAPYAKA